MKLLVVSNNYLQKSIISSKRWRCFSKYLSRLGHEVIVICGDDDSYSDELFSIEELQNANLKILKYGTTEFLFSFLLKIIRLIRGRKKNITQGGNITSSYLYLHPMSWYSYTKSYFLCWLETKIYELFSLSRFRHSQILRKIENEKFDCIIASCGPLDSIIIGEKIHKCFNKIPYYVEFRDMLHSRAYLNKAQNDFFINYEKKHVSLSSGTFVVSNGQKSMLSEAIGANLNVMDKIFVLYHGFEFSELKKESNILDNSSKLTITYTGTLDPAVENPEMLFHAISDLINERLINKENIQFIYAGLGVEYFEAVAAKYQLEKNVLYVGFVSPSESLQYQREADILLLLTDNSLYQRGILGGKFSEYLYASKPIISLSVGNLADAEISNLIKNMHIGIACEYVKYEESLLSLKEEFLCMYSQKMNLNKIDYNPKKNLIMDFSYECLTSKLISILENNVGKHK